MRNLILTSVTALIFASLINNQHTSGQSTKTEVLPKLDSTVQFSFYSNGDSVRYSKNEYSYDQIGRMILNASYRWDSTSNIWYGIFRYQSEFDEYGNICPWAVMLIIEKRKQIRIHAKIFRKNGRAMITLKRFFLNTFYPP